MQAINSSRKGGYVSYVGVPHVSNSTVSSCFSPTFICTVTCSGAPLLADLIKLVWKGRLNRQSIRPKAASRSSGGGLRAMDERRAIKTLLSP